MGDPPTTLLRRGDVLEGRYRVVRLIGRGGMGEVYEVRDLRGGGPRRGIRRALKSLAAELVDSPKARARFAREIELARRIAHPNVLRVFDLFEVPAPPRAGEVEARRPGLPCMVMEYLDGESIADRLGRVGRLSPAEALPLILQMAAGLSAAHAADVVHRDLKPDNVFLVDGGNGPERVVLTDFGVARPRAFEGESLTASNVILGTPSYMAPEVLELDQAVPASDIYSFGLVIYEMLTGHQAFEAESPIRVVFKRLDEQPTPPSRWLPDLDPRWEDAVMRCLARRPGDRFVDALELIEALDQPRERWSAGPPPVTAEAPPAGARRGALGWWLAAGLGAGVLIWLARVALF